MRVSQRLDYSLRAMVLLADQPPGTWVAAGDLADRLTLPRRFLEQQISVLARAGIVDCRRGASGGCMLARSAEEITVSDIVAALHGEVLDVPHQPGSASAELWQQASDALAGFLAGTTLSDLAKRQRELDARSAPMYYI